MILYQDIHISLIFHIYLIIYITYHDDIYIYDIHDIIVYDIVR